MILDWIAVGMLAGAFLSALFGRSIIEQGPEKLFNTTVVFNPDGGELVLDTAAMLTLLDRTSRNVERNVAARPLNGQRISPEPCRKLEQIPHLGIVCAGHADFAIVNIHSVKARF